MAGMACTTTQTTPSGYDNPTNRSETSTEDRDDQLYPSLAPVLLNTVPQQSFELADEMYLRVAKLRSNAGVLRDHAETIEARANVIEANAKELALAAQEDRALISTDLESVLKMYDNILGDFNKHAMRAKKLQDLVSAVEHGSATIEEVERQGDRFRRFLEKKERESKSRTRSSCQDMFTAIFSTPANHRLVTGGNQEIHMMDGDSDMGAIATEASQSEEDDADHSPNCKQLKRKASNQGMRTSARRARLVAPAPDAKSVPDVELMRDIKDSGRAAPLISCCSAKPNAQVPTASRATEDVSNTQLNPHGASPKISHLFDDLHEQGSTKKRRRRRGRKGRKRIKSGKTKKDTMAGNLAALPSSNGSLPRMRISKGHVAKGEHI